MGAVVRQALSLALCLLPTASACLAGPVGIVLHTFTKPGNGLNQDGANPAAGLALSGGLLCGTTVNGGLQGAGTAFFLAPDASGFKAFRSFTNSPDAANPQGDPAVSGNRLFGTTLGGGASGVGTVFVGQTNGAVAVIRSFTAVQPDTATNSDGASPSALLALSGGMLYGATTAGGASASGTLFSVTTNGSGFLVLHSFGALDSRAGTNGDGAWPWGGLILSGDTLYGTASAGGAAGGGVAFSVKTNGLAFTVLHHFSALDPVTATNPDGAIPLGGLLLTNATLYGTTTAGGTGGKGTVFSLSANGLGFAVLHHFSATDAVAGTNADGAAPGAALALSGSVLYGTTPAGGRGGSGTVFSVSTNGAQCRTLYSFTSRDSSSGVNSDGAAPISGLLPVGQALYGTTFCGGSGGVGTVFSLTLPPTPASITRIAPNADGSLTLLFLGGASSTNIVQATDELAPPAVWQNISTNLADSAGAWQFTETNHTARARFYRSYAF